MGAFEVIVGYATNPSTTITACTALTGQSFQVRATPEGSKTILQQVWANNKTGGTVRVKSPRMHDDQQGIRIRAPKENQRLLLPYDVAEDLYSTDTLEVQTSGGASETDQVALLVHYQQLPGTEAQLKTYEEIAPRIQSYMGVEITAKAGAAVSAWGAGVALNTSMDVFKKPDEYAILGYQLDTACTAVALKGTDIGEVRMGGPGAVEPDLTGEWFILLSKESGEAAIPVFNSQNVGNILAEVADTTAESEHHITFFCAQLS